jgi:hypothetical protein
MKGAAIADPLHLFPSCQSAAWAVSEMQRRGIISPDVDIDTEMTDAKAELDDRQPQRKENITI